MATFYTRLNEDQDNVFLSKNQKVIKITKRISSIDTVEFYSPFILWIEKLSKTDFSKIQDLSIIYMDSNMSTILDDIETISSLAKEKGLDIEFDWFKDVEIGTSYLYSVEKLKLNLKIKAAA